ncbi:hypothetical protein [Pseudomonas sp. Marseille-QA0892]
MALDNSKLESLLDKVHQHAGDAVDGVERDYRDAFLAAHEALSMLMDERKNWREMVARATEEYQGDEGI